MKTKVNNCGNYDCAHCSYEGRCLLPAISINQDGKCILFKEPTHGDYTLTPCG